MDKKDWILLLVPIFCNGIIIFTLEQLFEKRRLIKETKYNYIHELEQKLINTLGAWGAFKRTFSNSCSIEELKYCLEDVVDHHIDIILYCEQRELLFGHLQNHISRLRKIKIDLDNVGSNITDVMASSETTLKEMHKLCVEQKV